MHFMPGEVQLPAPRVLKAGDSHFAGYKGRVAYYFEGQVLGSDGVIRLDLLAGVCEEICIPAQANFEIPVSALMVSDPKSDLLLSMARSQLPGPANAQFGVSKAVLGTDGSLAVEASVPDGAAAELFVEGPEGWYFPQAELVSAGDGKAQFRVGAPQGPQGQAMPEKLRFTLAQAEAAVEQWLSPEK
jgi:DsbC/DsbD-like thiol-disulfide interchange protein